jgi:hypothetical protein
MTALISILSPSITSRYQHRSFLSRFAVYVNLPGSTTHRTVLDHRALGFGIDIEL